MVAPTGTVATPDLIERACTDLLVDHAVDVHHTVSDDDTSAYIVGCTRAVAEAPYRCAAPPPHLLCWAAARALG